MDKLTPIHLNDHILGPLVWAEHNCSVQPIRNIQWKYICIRIDIDSNICENDQFALLVRCSRFNPIWNICKIYSHFYGCYFLCSFILFFCFFFIHPPPPPADTFLRFRFTTHTHSHNKLFIAHTCYEKKEWKRMAILITKYLEY